MRDLFEAFKVVFSETIAREATRKRKGERRRGARARCLRVHSIQQRNVLPVFFPLVLLSSFLSLLFLFPPPSYTS